MINGSVLTSIVNAMNDGTLTGGAGKIIGKYTFVFDNGANRDADNTSMKAQLVELKLTVATSSATVNNIQVYIDGASSNKTTAVDTVAGVATIDLDEAGKLADSAEVDGEVTLVVIGTVSNIGANAYVQTNIADLTSASSDFTYSGASDAGSDLTNPRLSISEVIGGTLSN
jgi:hypothetical protein